MLESTSKEQLKKLIDILSFCPLSQINNWQNNKRIIHALAIASGFNTNKIKRFIHLFLSELQYFLSANIIFINFNSNMKLSDLTGWEGLNVLLVDAVFESFNQQNQISYSLNSILSSIDFNSLNLYSTMYSIFKSSGLNITEAESNEITNEAWSNLSGKERQALSAAGFNISNQIPVQSKQAKEITNKSSANSKNNMLRNIDQNFIDGLGDIAEELIDRTRNQSSNNEHIPPLAKNQERPR